MDVSLSLSLSSPLASRSYPSIIQEFNICFTTVKRDTVEDAEGNMVLPDVPPADADKGVLPEVLRRLIEKRGEVKKLIKTERDPARLIDYDIRQ